MRLTSVLVLLALISPAARAQQPTAATPTISGVVTTVDDVPLARVRVAAGTAGTESFTDARGQFQLRVSDAAPVRLSFSKTGYLAFAIDVPTRASSDRDTGLRVRLVPAGAISGRVLDQSGSPLRVTVTARRVGSPPSTPLSTSTNDLGEYRFSGLAEGPYVVAAQPPSDPVGGNPEARTAPPAVPVEAPPTNVRAGQESGNVDLLIALPSSTAQRVLGSLAPGGASPTASISGRVIGLDGAPIAGVSVFTTQGVRPEGWVAQTDAMGRYRIDRLVPGEHIVRARKNGYDTGAFGQVALRAGQQVSSVDIALSRGGAIAGTIVDEFGEPVEGVTVEVRGIVTVEGRPRLNPKDTFLTQAQTVSGGAVSLRGSRTDDRGRYRVFGLPAGTYVVQAQVRERAGSAAAYLPFYYPGTSVIDQATKVNLAADANAAGIDLVFRPQRGYRVSGRITTPDGRPARVGVTLAVSDRSQAIQIQSVNGQTSSDGSFTFTDVAPGEYVVQTVRAGSEPDEFAAAFVIVSNADSVPVELVQARGTTMTGNVSYAGATESASEVLSLEARPVDRDLGPRSAGSVGFSVERDGTFEFRGLFGLNTLIARLSRPDSYVKSIVVNSQDIVATPYDFGSGRTISGAEIILSATAASATGRVTDERLAPVRDCAVVIFPSARDKWVSGSQWVKTARPVQDGTFRIPGMPPGDYWVAAVDHLDEGSTTPDQGLLESLSFRATRITLGEGQSQDLTLRLIRR